MKVSEIFGELTFNESVMKAKMSKETFHALKKTIEKDEPLSREVANSVAHGLKEWALENNVTHFTHWFHPLTGKTAEKHDSFLQFDDKGLPIERFSASELIQGEPDASSFPSGGTRTTFEARGYSAWDPKSVCFIVKGENTNTLCIPSVFLSYNGDSLDKKSTLLKSIRTLKKSTRSLMKTMGYKVPETVNVTLGAEQEYYLIRKKLFEKREDLVITGRTLFGSQALRGQKLEDHYFGSINEDVKAFMGDVEHALYELGVPCKTRHNEVAPCQYEIAPIFEELNQAADHNQLVMMVLKNKAKKHGFSLLLHEKPFKGLNGSGKHNNWSIAGDDTNYFSPGKNRKEFIRFLAFLTGFINGISKHEKFIRASISSAANDHRLGGNEAPPSIVSVFVGQDLGKLLEELKKGNFSEPSAMEFIDMGLEHIPQIEKHNTDRNRTSTVAFTGNKFEFRALGSSHALGFHNTIVNAAVSDGLGELTQMIDQELKSGLKKEQAILAAISKCLKSCSRIVYNGNCYSKEWQKEAEKRKISNSANTPEALNASFGDKKECAFLIDSGIINERELEARFHIKIDQYCQTLEIEARTMLKIMKKHIRFAVIEQLQALRDSMSRLEKPYRELFNEMEDKESSLEKALKVLEDIEKEDKKAVYIVNNIIPLMDELRDCIDLLESETDRKYWTLPDYDQLLNL